MLRSKRAIAAAMGTMLLASVALAPSGAVAQTPTDLSLWVFVDGHGDFMVKQAEAWNAANPDRPINLTYTTTDYSQMHDNLTAAFLAGQGGPTSWTSRSGSSPGTSRPRTTSTCWT